MKQQLEAQRAKHASGLKHTYGDLAVFNKFYWLLATADEAEFNSWMVAVQERKDEGAIVVVEPAAVPPAMSVGGRARGGKGRGKGAGRGGSRAPVVTEDAIDARTSGMFD